MEICEGRIKVKCEQDFVDTALFAWESGLIRKFCETLDNLNPTGTMWGRPCTVHLLHDFAEHSFYWACMYLGDTTYKLPVGGMIFYKGRESGVTGQCSVTTSGGTDPRWEIHT